MKNILRVLALCLLLALPACALASGAVSCYWQLEACEHRDNFAQTAEHVRELLTDAIRRQLVSDVPIGTFLSGGLDSSYLAYLGSKWGLRILGVHVDDGFDTEISKNNIQKLCKGRFTRAVMT